MDEPIEKISDLREGDRIRNVRGSGITFMVTAVYGDRAAAVRTVDVTNPTEWVRCVPQKSPLEMCVVHHPDVILQYERDRLRICRYCEGRTKPHLGEIREGTRPPCEDDPPAAPLPMMRECERCGSRYPV